MINLRSDALVFSKRKSEKERLIAGYIMIVTALKAAITLVGVTVYWEE